MFRFRARMILSPSTPQRLWRGAYNAAEDDWSSGDRHAVRCRFIRCNTHTSTCHKVWLSVHARGQHRSRDRRAANPGKRYRRGGRIRPSMQPAPIRNPGELPPPVTFESSTASVARCENVVVEKTLQSAAEHIVVVAGDHMTGPGDVDQSGGRDELKQLFGALFADHV